MATVVRRTSKGHPGNWRSDGSLSGPSGAALEPARGAREGDFKGSRDAGRPGEGARAASGGVGTDA
jgi:hypothetical protein